MLISLANQGWAQGIYSHQFSSTPETSRYEIVQSERGARYTFKIDKYTGEVFQMAEKKNKDLTWELIILFENIRQEIAITDKVNYQVFISGIGARHIYLLHVDTGKTWQLAEDTESGIMFWDAIE